FGQRGEAERLSTGILVNFTDRTVKGLVDPPVKITTWNEVSVTFRSSYELPPSVVTTFGTIDRVTGDLEAFSGQRLADQDASPQGKGRWVYRDVDGRKCWFPAGRLRRGQEKPLEELQWPFTVGSPPSRVFQPASAASWVVEERWLEAPHEFVDAKGWSHKE